MRGKKGGTFSVNFRVGPNPARIRFDMYFSSYIVCYVFRCMYIHRLDCNRARACLKRMQFTTRRLPC